MRATARKRTGTGPESGRNAPKYGAIEQQSARFGKRSGCDRFVVRGFARTAHQVWAISVLLSSNSIRFPDATSSAVSLLAQHQIDDPTPANVRRLSGGTPRVFPQAPSR